MGREARCEARWGAEAGAVHALLETHELILRGDIRRTVAISALSEVRIDGDVLRFRVANDEVELVLGGKPAASWAKKIAAPPPSLASKLGVGPGAKVLVIGPVDDPALDEALAMGRTDDPKAATMSLAVVGAAAALSTALVRHADLPAGASIWVVNFKGVRSPFGENAVRAAMHAAGYMDTKTSAVSERYSATRYSRR
ncbi:hypothetical protein BH11PSE2_BH11PSE2_03470 [soil metagenome]